MQLIGMNPRVINGFSLMRGGATSTLMAVIIEKESSIGVRDRMVNG